MKTLLARLLTARVMHQVIESNIESNTVATPNIQATRIARHKRGSAPIAQGVIGDPLANARATTLQR